MKKLLLLNSVALLSPIFLIISCKAKEQPPQPEDPKPDVPKPEDPKPEVPKPGEVAKPKEDTKVITQISIDKLKWEKQSIANFSTIEFTEKIKQSIKKFVLENKNTFFSGEISKIENEQDLGDVTIENKSDTSLFLNIVVESNRWYKGNEIQTSQLSQKVELTNFKALPVSSLDETGGKLSDSNLNATKYAKLLDLFRLNEKTPLSTLTDEFFNNKLKEIEQFKNLNIKIESGSTKTGKLSLSLSGAYGNSNITTTSIEISGFLVVNAQSVGIQNLTLNKNAWFNDLKPIQDTSNKEDEIKGISSDDWQNKYVENFLIQDDNHKTISNFQEMKKIGMNFEISSSIKANTTISLTISGTFKNKTYDKASAKWNDDLEEIKFTQYAGRNGEATLFTKSEVEQYLLDKTEVDEEKLKTYYPSYFLGLLNHHKKLNTNFVINDLFINDQFNKINGKYLNWDTNGFTYAINNQHLEANDFKNTLSFGINFVVGGKIKQDKIKNFTFSNKNKNINENSLIKNNLKNRLTPAITDFSSNSVLKAIKSRLKSSSYKEQVDKAYKIGEKEIITIENINKLIPDTFTRNTYLQFADDSDVENVNVEKNWTHITKYFTPYLFDKELKFSKEKTLISNVSNEINANSGIYRENEQSKFFIESIYYYFSENTNLKLINVNPNTITVLIELKTEVNFSSNEKIIYDTSFSFAMIKTQWEESAKKK